MSKRILIAVGAAALALVTACSSSGKGSGSGSTSPASRPPASSSAAPPAAAGSTISQQDGVLTGADGRTLYANTVDTVDKITCVDACAAQWPPVPGPATAAGTGLDASKLGIAVRPDGTKQATYDGHPLYVFNDDKAAGDKKGEGIDDAGGTWHVATVTGPPSSAPPSSTGDDSTDQPSGPPPSSTTY
jgi:predicted lipoprotein with Yx(FWY)xxD motif